MKPSQVEYLKEKTIFSLGSTTYTVPLTGEYNLYNTLAAITTALLLDVSPIDIKRALTSFKGVRGRLEEISNSRGIHAFVDFAHTPNALRSVLANLHTKLGPGESLIVVFGSAGLRDASKRPLMGAAAAEFADKIVITSEDPRIEDPKTIAQAIMTGIPKKKRHKVVIELDRHKAIDYAVNHIAKPGDWVVTCGKGHEESMNLDGYTETPWSEHEALTTALTSQPRKNI